MNLSQIKAKISLNSVLWGCATLSMLSGASFMLTLPDGYVSPDAALSDREYLRATVKFYSRSSAMFAVFTIGAGLSGYKTFKR